MFNLDFCEWGPYHLRYKSAQLHYSSESLTAGIISRGHIADKPVLFIQRTEGLSLPLQHEFLTWRPLGQLPGNPSKGLLSQRENFHYSHEAIRSMPASVMKPSKKPLGDHKKDIQFILVSYLHAGAAAPPLQRWSCGGPEAGSRPWQSHCRSGSRDGSGPAEERWKNVVI